MLRSPWRLRVLAVLILISVFWLPSSAFAACASPVGDLGNFIYNRDYHVPQYCDGTLWKATGKVGGSGAGGTGCTDPVYNEGQFVYNNDYSVLQYCDGYVWRAMGKQVPPPAAPSTACADTPGSTDTQNFTTAGGPYTWTKPAGTWVCVECWGGGGGNAEIWVDTSSLGATEAVTVGAGSAATGSGGDSIFGAVLTVKGGYQGEQRQRRRPHQWRRRSRRWYRRHRLRVWGRRSRIRVLRSMQWRRLRRLHRQDLPLSRIVPSPLAACGDAAASCRGFLSVSLNNPPKKHSGLTFL